MAISIKTPEDIEKMRVAGRLAAEVLEMIEPYVKPGVSTGELDRICNDYIVNEQHAVSACLGYHGYPKSVCISINEVVCHGIPSPLIWNKYLEYQEQSFPNPDNIRFRDKFYGYKYSTMSIIRNGKNVYHAGSQLDPMLRAFFSDACDRPSCYECPFKKRYRVGDFTIWDCFSVYDFDKKMDDDKGTTRVLCHSQKDVEPYAGGNGVRKVRRSFV